MKTTQVTVRLTEDERDKIRKSANDARLTEAGYIRSKVLDRKVAMMPPSLEMILKKLLEENHSVGQSINRMARENRMRGTFTASDYRKLMQYLEKLNKNYEKLEKEVKEVVK